MAKPTFFARYALLILVLVFFLVPFALRGARLALQGMKNDVKDWLPSDFAETRDLAEFRRYFLSEQFVLVSWDGCYGDETDERFKLFLAKLTPELPPSLSVKPPESLDAEAAASADSPPASGAAKDAEPSEPEGSIKNPTRYVHRNADFIGDKLGLYFGGGWYEDWGGKREKWLRGRRLEGDATTDECWYYLTPDGDLHRWDAVDSPVASLTRVLYRWVAGKDLKGTLVHAFGPVDGAWYHDDPRRLRAQLFKTITTGPDVLASLVREGGELDATREETGEANLKEAQRRLQGTLFGPRNEETGKQATCVMLTLTDPARRNLHLVCGRGLLGKPRGRLYEIAGESNIPESELRLGGPPIDNVAIDEEGSITLVRLVSYSAVLGIVLSLVCFRSISATIMLFFVGGVSALMSLGLVWWWGSSIDAIMLSMPSLVYVLGLSGAAHILNYYHEAVEEHGYVGAPERALAHGWKPALLCEVTTALGLLSLLTSELVPIRKFGWFSALGVMAMMLVLFTYLPAALQIWPLRRRKAAGAESSWLDQRLAGIWQRLGGWIIDHHTLVAVGCTLVIVLFACGLAHMRTSVNLLKMFHAEAKIIRDYEWLEANLGQLVPMEVVVRVPRSDQRPSSTTLAALNDELAKSETSASRKSEIEKALGESQFQLSFLERMELAAGVQNVIEGQFGHEGRGVVGRAISAATFVRPLPRPGGGTFLQSQRSTTSGRLEAHRDDFLHSDYLRISEEDQTELWRISLRVYATKGVDYGAFVSDLQQTVEPVIAAQRQREAILRQIADQRRQQGNSDAPLANARVLMVGMPAATPAADDSENGPAAATASTTVDQDRIFARTLRDLLLNSRLRLDLVAADSRQLPANLEAALGAYDCVVLVGNVAGLDAARLQQAARLVIDAREHAYSPHTTQRTAWQRDPAGVAAVYTGVVPIVYKAQRMLLDSLIQSTFWSVITITPLLMWIARSVAAGSVAMLPNILPIVMVFGGMGWLGIDVDVGSMMTASIALGVAVDDTIHFLNWFREELDRLGDRKKAILAAYKHCATPTLQAAVISGLGLSVFALSTFTPTQRFGCLMLVILWLGAVAELIYFPALLAGPLGSVFKPRKKAAGSDSMNGDAGTSASPPRLQVVHDDEPSEEAAEVADGNGDGRHPAGPHRNVRQDAPHRRA